MRIGIISGEYPPMQGGVGDYSRALAREFVALGHDVFVLSSDKARPVANDSAITVQPTVHRWGRWHNKRTTPRGEHQALEWIRSHQLDLVNVQYQAAAFDMHLAANRLPKTLGQEVPVVTTFHDLMVPYLFPKAGVFRKRVVYQMARSSRAVVVTNVADELELRTVGDMPPIKRIPIGSNIAVNPPERYDPYHWREQRLHVPKDVLLIGYFGFINASKGVDDLARAVRLLTEQDVSVELLIIGGQTGDSDASNIEQADLAERLVGGLGINRRVHWTGFVEEAEVSAHLMACDVIALPFKDGVSFRRGTLMAALAHACPIVTTYPEVEIPELIDGENVRMIPPDNPVILAEALRDLYQHPNFRQKLGQGAGQLAQQFQWDHIAQETIGLFESVLQQVQQS